MDKMGSKAMISSEERECQRFPGTMFTDDLVCRPFQIDGATYWVFTPKIQT